MHKYYGEIEFTDWELYVDCLEFAVNKENQLPRLLNQIYDMVFNKEKTIIPINKKMRSAEEIMKDYGL